MSEPFYTDEAVTIWNADALALPFPDSSVDLVVTSPPYFGLRSYRDDGEHYEGQIGDEATPSEFVAALVKATEEMVRVLKPGGSIWVNLGDKYASQGGHGRQGETSQRQGRKSAGEWLGRSERNTTGVPLKSLVGIPWRYALRCIDDLELILRAEVIWSKPNGMPESVTDRVRRVHEQWFHFVREPRYFSALDELRQDEPTAGPRGSDSVWPVATQPLRVPEYLPQHFAAYPLELPRRIIRGWCPEGGTVLDPFGGTGTTALAAKVLGRTAWHVDLSADYCRLAQWRVTDPCELARAMEVEKPPPSPEGMGSLLDLLGDGAA